MLSFGKWLQGVINSEHEWVKPDPLFLQHDRLQQRAAAAGASEAVPADGGFLAGPEHSSQIIQTVYMDDQVIARMRQAPMGKNKLTIPGIDEQSRKDGSRGGGARGYWVNEADALTGSKPKFRLVNLEVHKVAVVCYLTEELVQDANALEVFTVACIAKELSFKLVDAAVNGTGAGQPQGILNSGALITVAKQTGQSAGTILGQNIVDMYSRLWVGSRASAVWLVHSDAVSQLLNCTIAVGSAGSELPLYHPTKDPENQPYATMLGCPVLPIEQAQAVGTTGDIILADMSQYCLGLRERAREDVSMEVKFLTDEYALRLICRADGQSLWHTPIQPFNATNTQSPFIALAARS